ncbi:Uncharacterised protein [Escherichia coli]|uniref:Uncharacterized protein n=1 Tax=Escherichia coli TaxID=562 RepID=A0A377D5S4_ECOLX|nr:Uncharacterised protein [Escherichia coli]
MVGERSWAICRSIAAGMVSCNSGKFCPDAVNRLDNIGFRQLADHQQNSRFGIGHPGVTYILYRVGHRRQHRPDEPRRRCCNE